MGYCCVCIGCTLHVVIPAIRCIAFVKSYHDMAPSLLKWYMPGMGLVVSMVRIAVARSAA